jgi:hypothetical protein
MMMIAAGATPLQIEKVEVGAVGHRTSQTSSLLDLLMIRTTYPDVEWSLSTTTPSNLGRHE